MASRLTPRTASGRFTARIRSRTTSRRQTSRLATQRGRDDEALPAAQARAATDRPFIGKCCKVAPPVLVYDQAGNLVKSWGGPGKGYDWPDSNHGITVDHEGNVWLAGNGDKDTQLLEVRRRRQVSVSDWQARCSQRQQRYRQLLEADEGLRGRVSQRGLCWRRLRQPPSDCVRRCVRQIQAALGRIRQPGPATKPFRLQSEWSALEAIQHRALRHGVE